MPDRIRFDADTSPLRPELLAHCYRMMGSAADAEDQVQETYLRAWKGYADFEGRCSVRTWMYRIATNTCLNALGSAGRRVLPTDLATTPGTPTAPLSRGDHPWLGPLPDAMLWSSASPTPEEQLLERENITLAWTAALAHLPPNQRAVLLLRDVLALSATETAETLNTSVAAVNSALQRARGSVGDGLAEPSAPPERETAAIQRFVDAFEQHDYDAVVASVAEDVTWHMPPFTQWYRGRRDVADLAWTHCPARSPDDLRYASTRSNGGPALGMYLRKGDEFEAFQFQVLRVNVDGLVDHVTGWFEPHLFRLAGLPTSFHESTRPSGHRPYQQPTSLFSPQPPRSLGGKTA